MSTLNRDKAFWCKSKWKSLRFSMKYSTYVRRRIEFDRKSNSFFLLFLPVEEIVMEDFYGNLLTNEKKKRKIIDLMSMSREKRREEKRNVFVEATRWRIVSFWILLIKGKDDVKTMSETSEIVRSSQSFLSTFNRKRRHTFDVELKVVRVLSLPYSSGKFFFKIRLLNGGNHVFVSPL